jgi:hypothetical protein
MKITYDPQGNTILVLSIWAVFFPMIIFSKLSTITSGSFRTDGAVQLTTPHEGNFNLNT